MLRPPRPQTPNIGTYARKPPPGPVPYASWDHFWRTYPYMGLSSCFGLCGGLTYQDGDFQVSVGGVRMGLIGEPSA